MKFKGVFPDFYRAFADGETAVCMERYGGIDELSLIDVEEKDGVPLPDNHYLKIFSRQGKSSGRPLCGSAIRFLNLAQDGTQDYLFPKNPDVHPWGVLSQNFTFFIDRQRLCFLCSKAAGEQQTLRMVISTEHLFRGERPSIKNQRMTPSALRLCQEAGIRPDPNQPFPNGTATLSWQEPVFRRNALVFSGKLTFPYGKREICLAVVPGQKAVLSKSSALLLLDMPWQQETQIPVAAAFGKSEEQAVAAAEDLLGQAENLCQDKCRRDRQYDKTVANARCANLPDIGHFFSEQNRYLHALLIADGIAVRAATYKFSFFAMWDAIFPIRDFLRNGEFSQAKKMYRYLLHYPHMEYYPWGAMHLVIMLEEILSYGSDDELLQEAYPVLERFFEFARHVTSPKTGFIATANNCGTDVMKEMGIDGLHDAVCVNAFYYSALRIMENFSLASGKDATQYRSIRKTMEQSYLKYFYVEKEGYLRLALEHPSGKPAPIEVFENTATIGLEGPFGEFLLHDRIRELADYQTQKLRHPLGRLAVAHDSQIPCEMWRNVHMNQHLGHEMMLARLGNRVPEAYRVMGEYFKVYHQYGVAMETFNTAGSDGNNSQTANWQSFSATAAATAVLTGLAGIQHHRGGYAYIPADDSGDIQLKNLPCQGTKLNVSLEGTGNSAKMFFNGQEIKGTMQLPDDLPLTDINQWRIVRCTSQDACPILLSASGLPVRNLTANHDKVTFTAGRSGSFPIHVQGVKHVSLNQKILDTPNTGSDFLDLDVHVGDHITLEK